MLRLAPAVLSAMLEPWSEEAVLAAVASAKRKKGVGSAVPKTPTPATPDTDMALLQGTPGAAAPDERSQERGGKAGAGMVDGAPPKPSPGLKSTAVRNSPPPLSPVCCRATSNWESDTTPCSCEV